MKVRESIFSFKRFQRTGLRSLLTLSRRYIMFSIVGLSGVLVDMTVLWLLFRKFHYDLLIAKAMAAECAIINNFLWNDCWTFSDYHPTSDFRNRSMRFVKFNLIYLVGIAIGLWLLHIQVDRLLINELYANFNTIVVVSGLNFFLILTVERGTRLRRIDS